MSIYTRDRIKKFVTALFWNVGVYLVLFMIDTISKNMGGYNLTSTELTLASIFLARCTKYINVSIQNRQYAE